MILVFKDSLVVLRSARQVGEPGQKDHKAHSAFDWLGSASDMSFSRDWTL
jgi:hypothetical protein